MKKRTNVIYKLPDKPGKIIKNLLLDPIGMSVNAFSKEIGITQNRAQNLISGQIRMTAPTAIIIGKYFRISPEVFMTMQNSYDLALAKKKMAEK